MGHESQTTSLSSLGDDIPEGVVVGETLAGKYRVDRLLGAGGMGVVVQATHLMLNTRVAMKFLLPQYANDTRIVERFLREARAAVSLKNRHVASVSDIGTLESGSPFIVMEYLEGSDLGVAIEAESRLDVERALRLLLQACQGLASAHAAGVVHRDIKPGNLFLARDADGSEQIKILDFGISKSGQEVNNLTQTGAVMGSPNYMSPEQIRSTRNVDHRSDIWSLGVVGFEMLTGHLPYDAETMTALVAMVLEHDPPRVKMLRPDVPAEVDEAIAKALTKDPAQRYANVAEFARDLANALGDAMSLESAARTERILFSPGSSVGTNPSLRFDGTLHSTTDQASFVRTRLDANKKTQTRRMIFIAAGALAVIGLGALGIAGFLGFGGPTAEEIAPVAQPAEDVGAQVPALAPTEPPAETAQENAGATAEAPEVEEPEAPEPAEAIVEAPKPTSMRSRRAEDRPRPRSRQTAPESPPADVFSDRR